MNPFAPFRRRLSPEFIATWQRYEAANKRAANEYADLPVAFNRAAEGLPCTNCRRRHTRAKDGVCPACKKGES